MGYNGFVGYVVLAGNLVEVSRRKGKKKRGLFKEQKSEQKDERVVFDFSLLLKEEKDLLNLIVKRFNLRFNRSNQNDSFKEGLNIINVKFKTI